MIDLVKRWVKKLMVVEGPALIAMGAIILFAQPIATLAAYVAIVIGLWSIWKNL